MYFLLKFIGNVILISFPYFWRIFGSRLDFLNNFYNFYFSSFNTARLRLASVMKAFQEFLNVRMGKGMFFQIQNFPNLKTPSPDISG